MSDQTQAAPRVSEQDERAVVGFHITYDDGKSIDYRATEREARAHARELDENGWLDVKVLPLTYRAALTQGAQAAQGGGVQAALSKQMWDLQEFYRDSPKAIKAIEECMLANLAAHPAPSAAPAQPDEQQAHVMPPFAAPAGQHDAATVAAYAQWMHDSSKFPHADDTRHPFDAFAAGVAVASRCRAQGGNTSNNESQGAAPAQVAQTASLAKFATALRDLLRDVEAGVLDGDAVREAQALLDDYDPEAAQVAQTGIDVAALIDECRDAVVYWEPLKPFIEQFDAAPVAPSWEPPA